MSHNTRSNALPTLLTRPEVCALLKISKATLYRQIERGHLPPPVMVAPRIPRWPEADLMRALQRTTDKSSRERHARNERRQQLGLAPVRRAGSD
ncbi:helix-turn-helix transcriptional regulator [Luteimonas sp. e5]